MTWKRLSAATASLLLINAGYLLVAREASLLHAAQILLHPLLALAVLSFLALDHRRVRQALRTEPLRAAFTGVGAVVVLTGVGLVIVGANRPLLAVHLGAAAGFVLLLAHRRMLLAPLVVAVSIPVGGLLRDLTSAPGPARNAELPPATMAGEAMGGASGPFFPSAAKTAHGGLIPEDFFTGSDKCGRCHQDITRQWEDSAHRFASFNNPWYRRSIEYMQSVVGVTPSKWCAGCHDHAVLFSGLMDRPVEEIVDLPAASAGLGCVSCHAITEVRNTMGNGGFVIEYPELNDLAASENPLLRSLHDLVIHLDPEPHRQAFLKPIHEGDSSAFCSSCHKVHLDEPVNAYRWLRGFNSYDNWQASGVSGHGARSFYYPGRASTCADCHMPPVPGEDPAAEEGLIRSHRFAAANTALPVHFGRDEQLQAVRDFLMAGQVTVDIFGLVRGGGVVASEGPTGTDPLTLASTFAVGEEAMAAPGRQAATGPPGELTAPLDLERPALRPGETVRVDVVVRTRKVGHFFPSGTVDAHDVWLEFRAEDAAGRVFFWSGFTEGEDAPVEPSAHFLRSLMLDGRGNPINKRNAWAARSALYVTQIPPGAAHTVRYRVRIPEDAAGPLTLTARLNYRKFAWWHTQWVFRGTPLDDGEVAPGFDDRTWILDPDREAPDVPIVTMASAELELPVGEGSAPREGVPREVALRFNDYGIGLLLQGDLRGAEAAFRRVAELNPSFPDAPVNLARVLIREGDPEGALEAVDAALALAPGLPRALFFRALARKALGRYDDALEDLRAVAEAHPGDRVVNNQIGRLHFLKREYAEAVRVLERTLRIDPEDLEAHYNLMLAARGLRDPERTTRHRELYLRFKADESADATGGDYRRTHPEDNNERLPIHEHRNGLDGASPPEE